jgi:NADH-quinone oxidoreductase subunit I
MAQQTKIGFWEKLYVPEVLRGLSITSRHFLENISIHIAQLFGAAKTKRGAVTIQYPEERRPYAPRLRTRHRLMKRSNGEPRCVACCMCETTCPAFAIYIKPAPHPDPEVEKYPEEFIIDLSRCVFCGFCVEACPEDAIRMDTGVVELAAYDRASLILTKGQLLAEPAPSWVPPSGVLSR